MHFTYNFLWVTGSIYFLISAMLQIKLKNKDKCFTYSPVKIVIILYSVNFLFFIFRTWRLSLVSKKRGYDYSYIEYGCTFIILNGKERPQCIFCSKTLSNNSVKPTSWRNIYCMFILNTKTRTKAFLKVMGMLLKIWSWIQQVLSRKQTKWLLKLLEKNHIQLGKLWSRLAFSKWWKLWLMKNL